MSTLTGEQVAAAILASGLSPVPPDTAAKLADYGNLLMKWNAKTNLTSISDADGVLHRHLVESVAAAQALPSEAHTLLDYGSGGGLPGIPIALFRPDFRVTLAESQSKKVAFLREALRVLGLGAEVFAGRVEDLDRRFDVVCMRAVDKMVDALEVAVKRVDEGGLLVLFVTDASERGLLSRLGDSGVRLRDAGVAHRPLPTAGKLLLIRLPMFHVEQ